MVQMKVVMMGEMMVASLVMKMVDMKVVLWDLLLAGL